MNADAIFDYMKLERGDCLYIAKSMSHSSTLTGELLVSLRSGANVVLAPTVVPPRYVLSRIKEFSVTTLCLNPTLLRMFSEECKKKSYDLTSLKTIYCSGSILNDKVYSEAHEVFKGIDIFNAVSYTHLDVYKRQEIWCRFSDVRATISTKSRSG